MLLNLVAERTLNLHAFGVKSFNQNLIQQNELAHPKEEMHTAYIADGLIEQAAGPPKALQSK